MAVPNYKAKINTILYCLQVTELVLDNRCIEVAKLSDKFKNLRRLSIVNAGLASLKGFPTFPNLHKVYFVPFALFIFHSACIHISCN